MNYLKLYFSYMKRSFISRLEYKKDTLISIFSFLLTNVFSILSIYFIIQSIPSLKGWDMYELGFLYGFSMLAVSLDHLFTDDLWLVAYRKVQSGELDKYFLRPIPVLFQVIAEVFQPEGFGELIVGIVMITFCSFFINISWSFGVVLLLIISVFAGALVISSLKIIFASLAFPFKRSGQLLQIVYNFISYTRYPISIFPGFIKSFLTFVLPFALFISIPVEVMFFSTMNAYILILIEIGVAIIFFLLSLFIWNILEKKYQSSGS